MRRYYNSHLFYNVQPGLLAQCGDPTATGKGGTSVYGLCYGAQAKYFEDECSLQVAAAAAAADVSRRPHAALGSRHRSPLPLAGTALVMLRRSTTARASCAWRTTAPRTPTGRSFSSRCGATTSRTLTASTRSSER